MPGEEGVWYLPGEEGVWYVPGEEGVWYLPGEEGVWPHIYHVLGKDINYGMISDVTECHSVWSSNDRTVPSACRGTLLQKGRIRA